MLAQMHTTNKWLYTLDPLSKLVTLFCVALLVMHWDSLLSTAILLVLLIATARYGAEMSWSKLGKRMMFIMGFGLPLFLLTALAAPAGEGAYLVMGPLKISQDAISAAAVVTLRMFILFLSSLIYIETTDPKDFVVVMTTYLRLPYRLVFGVSVALAFLPLLESEGRNARAARKIRGGRAPRGVVEKVSDMQGRLFTIFTGAIRRVQQTAGAMDAKGFGAYQHRTYLRETRIRRSGYMLAISSITVSTVLWFL